MRPLAFIVGLLATLILVPAYALAQDADATPAPAVADAAPSDVAPAPAPAPAPEVDPEDIGSIITGIIYAVKHAKWAWLIALILMVGTYLVNRVFKTAIPKNVLVWVSLGVGVATNIALSLASGLGIWESIGQGITLGLAAAGGWSAIGKHILPKAKTEEATS